MKSLSFGFVFLATLASCAPTIVAQQPATTAGLRSEVAKQQPALARTIALRSENYPDRFLRHQNFMAELSPIASDLDRLDSTFRMVPGLGGLGTVSFESVNYPGKFLRHQNFRIGLQQNDGTPQFFQDASFRVVPGLANPSMSSFQAMNYADRYLRHREFHVYLESGSGDVFRHDATFSLQPR